jgi:hypothetical protein
LRIESSAAARVIWPNRCRPDVFPDFGLPFELCSTHLAVSLGFERSPEQIEAGN